MLCEYGCGNTAKFQFTNKKWCCADRFDRCPAIIQKRIQTRKNKGWKHSEESKEKISAKSRGKKLSEEWKQKIGESHKGIVKGPMSESHKQNLSASLKGKSPWNKGLTSKDPRVASYANKQTGQKRSGNYFSSDNWKGSNNPWFGKDRSKEKSPRYNGEEYNRKLLDYRNKVSWLTEQTYNRYKDIINPNNKPRTLAGVNNGYHLDHIYPVSKGFENSIPPEILAGVENLRLIDWRENVVKSNEITEDLIPLSVKKYLQKNN
jgi:hypothetical protein